MVDLSTELSNSITICLHDLKGYLANPNTPESKKPLNIRLLELALRNEKRNLFNDFADPASKKIQLELDGKTYWVEFQQALVRRKSKNATIPEEEEDKSARWHITDDKKEDHKNLNKEPLGRGTSGEVTGSGISIKIGRDGKIIYIASMQRAIKQMRSRVEGVNTAEAIGMSAQAETDALSEFSQKAHLSNLNTKKGAQWVKHALIMHKVPGFNLSDAPKLDDPETGEKYSTKLRALPFGQRLIAAYLMAHQVNRLHEKNFVHRDVKPQNFMLALMGDNNLPYPTLIDFGSVKKDTDKREYYGTTFAYASREIYKDGGDVSFKDDSFGLAASMLMVLGVDNPLNSAVSNYDLATLHRDGFAALARDDRLNLVGLDSCFLDKERKDAVTKLLALLSIDDASSRLTASGAMTQIEGLLLRSEILNACNELYALISDKLAQIKDVFDQITTFGFSSPENFPAYTKLMKIQEELGKLEENASEVLRIFDKKELLKAYIDEFENANQLMEKADKYMARIQEVYNYQAHSQQSDLHLKSEETSALIGLEATYSSNIAKPPEIKSKMTEESISLVQSGCSLFNTPSGTESTSSEPDSGNKHTGSKRKRSLSPDESTQTVPPSRPTNFP